jgi:ABC-type branched-subunit amino acid transport system substrate-binding protein
MSDETPPPPPTEGETRQQPANPPRRKFLRNAGLVAAGLAIGAAVGGSAGYVLGSSSVKLPAGLKQGTGTFTIGTSISTSGETADVISQEVQAFDALVTLINNRGGVYAEDMGGYIPLRMIVLQDGGPTDLPTIKSNYTTLCTSDKVDMCIGPFTAAPSETASPVAIQYGVPYIDAQADEVPIYNQPGASDWVFGSLNLINYWMWNYLNLIKETDSSATLALIDEGDDFDTEAAGTGPSKFGAYQMAKSLGLDVVLQQTGVNSGLSATFDYSTEVQTVKNSGADIVIYFDLTAALAAIFLEAIHNEFKSTGWKPQAFHTTNGAQIAFTSTAGALATGYTADVYWDNSFPYEGLWGKNTWAQVQTNAKFTDLDWPWISIGYSCVENCVQAVQIAGSTNKTDVASALKTMEFTNILGPWKAQNPLTDPFAPQTLTPSFPNIVNMSLSRAIPVQLINVNGTLTRTLLYPADIATGTYKYPEPLFPNG